MIPRVCMQDEYTTYIIQLLLYLFSDQSWMRHVFEPPFFDTTTPRNVTALQGKTAHLHCKVKRLNNKTVSHISAASQHGSSNEDILNTGSVSLMLAFF